MNMEKSTNLVVKTNQLNVALQNLSLTEIHIIQLAIVDARETGKGLSTNTPLSISALRYAEVFNTTRQNAYKVMKKAEDTLFNRRFTYTDKDGKPVKSRWIQQAKYFEGRIEVVFTLAVVEAITRIDGIENFFTSYLLEQTVDMTSNYSVRLYELLVQWRKAKKTPVFELGTFRKQLGVPDELYQTSISDFKKRVLDKGIKEINKLTDLKVSYEQEKQGRKIIGFKFKVLEKPKLKQKKVTQEDEDKLGNGDLFTIDGLSDAQLQRITRSPKFKTDYNHLVSPNSPINQDQTGWRWTSHFVNELKKDASRFEKRPMQEYLDY